jgi:hypothetical protein
MGSLTRPRLDSSSLNSTVAPPGCGGNFFESSPLKSDIAKPSGRHPEITRR